MIVAGFSSRQTGLESLRSECFSARTTRQEELMQNLFDAEDRDRILRRLSTLELSSPRQWGKMNPAQMLAHCAIALEVPCGDRVKKQALIGRVLAPFVRSSVLGEKPFGHNAPTDPEF